MKARRHTSADMVGKSLTLIKSKMKAKKIMIFITLVTIFSCNPDNKNSIDEKEYEMHRPEGVVILNKQQREALNLKLGKFQMRNLTTVIKTN